MIDENKGISPEKPCLVQAGQGFSVLYKERFLYSKYSPERSTKQAVDNLSVSPYSLIILYSPCLWLGLKELLLKLPEQCEIFAVEEDALLFDFAKEQLNKLISEDKIIRSKASLIHLIKSSEIEKEIKPLHRFRKCFTLAMSGGTFFNNDLYNQISIFAQNQIQSFWKNRITLVKLGRLFSRNYIKNLKASPAAFSIPYKADVINRPIIIFGAGESTETFIKEADPSIFKKSIIIAVDAVLPALLQHGIDPDFTIAVEGQLAIEKAYIGTAKSKTILIADTVSRPGVIKRAKGRCLFFCSEYSEGNFFNNAIQQGILPVKIPGLGSVGLTAVYIALLMRQSPEIPVIVTGLDFSYTAGRTHTKGVPHHLARLNSSTHFSPVENYMAAFKIGAQFVPGKNGYVITDTALYGYARLFIQYFSSVQNLFDAGTSGINLNLPALPLKQIKDLTASLQEKNNIDFEKLLCSENKAEILQKSNAYLENEKQSLLRLRELLSNGNKAQPAPSPDLNSEISRHLSCREYLFLHFADGYNCDVNNISFLKRVRSEIDFFLKDLS